ncbi:MAG TPA: methyltransferase domain-containing protein [Polyangiaceae bacterium]|nr:methyltransferase domain-containing protein [Polyangiaceae bacterium]
MFLVAIMAQFHRVRIWPLPAWLDWQRLLGPGSWNQRELASGGLELEANLDRAQAADLEARLHGVGLGGQKLHLEITPKLHRSDVRKARLEEARRYRQGSVGFSKSGVVLDDETRRFLTPQALALQLGEKAKELRVIDACCGAGGNAIGFARAGCTVTAIEIDGRRLQAAQHNASVYGVANRITFIAGDATEIVPELQADLLFVDPPWGERYNTVRMTLEELPPLSTLVQRSTHIAQLWAKVPPSFDPATVPDCAAQAYFGVGAGDDRRVKFLLLTLRRPC